MDFTVCMVHTSMFYCNQTGYAIPSYTVVCGYRQVILTALCYYSDIRFTLLRLWLHVSAQLLPFSSLFQTYVGTMSQSNTLKETVVLQCCTYFVYEIQMIGKHTMLSSSTIVCIS